MFPDWGTCRTSNRGGYLLKSVLLVESDGPKAAGYRHALERTGLSVVAMPEGERALDRVRSQRPDLVIAASALKDMSGFSLCNRLRRVPGFADLPIVLVSAAGDADAVEAHRGGKTPATQYLPPDAPANDLAKCAMELLGVPGKNGEEDPSAEPLELELLPEDASEEPADRTVIQARPSVPPPLPVPAGGPPPLRKTARPDPFADLPADPRLPKGASPDEKVQYFRERLKAKDDLFARVRDAYQALRDDLEGAERDLAAARKDLDERQHAREQAEQALAQLRSEHNRASRDLDAAQTELSRGVHETATLRQDAEERAQSLSQLLNEAMQEREEENKQWSAKLADGERKLALLQEEVDHLASELDARGQELATIKGGTGELQAAMEEIRQRAQEDSAVLAEKLEELKAQNAALASDLTSGQAALEIKEADLAAELARGEANASAVTEAQEAVEATRAEWQAERQAWEEKQNEAQVTQEALEQRVAESEATLAELRGELEAVHEAEQQAAGEESRLVEMEAELSSRVDELNGLRSELERVTEERAQQETESGARLADLAGQLDEKERQLLEKDGLLQAKEEQLQEAVAAQTSRDEQATQALEEAQQNEARAHGAEVELQRAETRARAAESEAAEAEGRARDGENRIARLEASLLEAETRAEAAQTALAKVAQPAPSSGSNPPGGGDKALRVRVSDLTLELQTLRAKLAQAQGTGLSAEVVRLREELEAQRAENDFLTGELDRVQGGGMS